MMDTSISYHGAATLAIALLCTVGLIRLSVCLPGYARRRRRQVQAPLRTMVIFGSGGHTTEMIMLIEKLQFQYFVPLQCIIAQTDQTSRAKVDSAKLDIFSGSKWHLVSRSREVKQSWISTVFTTLWSLLQSFAIVWRIRPQLIICNGPGTCVPLCYVACLYKLLGIMDSEIVFVESFCRVQKLSLTGRLLYYIADKFIVQWPQLAAKHPRAEYLGDLNMQ